MSAVKCTVSLDNLIHHLEVDIDCTVLEVNPAIFPKVKPGMIVTSINDTSVRDRTDLKVEMLAISENPKAAKAPIVMMFEVRDAAEDAPISLQQSNKTIKKKKRDEFDFDSDDEKPTEPKFSVDSGKQVILNATNKTAPGACILLLCERFNPAYQIEEAARSKDITVMHIDAVVRVKSRLPIKEFGSTLRKSLERGVWIFIENACKSITLLQELVECINAAKEKKSIHTNSRVLLLCEPHPYFPPQLLEGAVTLRMRMAPGEQMLEETIKDPRSKLQLMQGTSQCNSKTPNLPTTSMKKRTVKISSVVEVVPLETSALLEMSASAVPYPENDDENTVREGLYRVAKYRFGPNEKLISLCSVGEDRFAVGTSSGYVVVLDCNGLPLIQYRPHKACIWDLAFASTYDFSTASEDGSSSVFTYHVVQQTLEATSVASFQSDVFALTYTRPSDPSSAVLSGGLSATICVLHSDRKSSSFIPASTSIQAMRAITTRNLVLFGGGSGSCALVDPEKGTTVETVTKHTRKVPAVSAYENMALSGSFDKTLRVWDIRSGMHCSHNLVMPDVLTATAISGYYTAACSGSSIYLWDLRNFNQILAVKNKAWSGLTRGLVMDHNKKLLATASVDGIARFWKFDQ